MNFEISINNNEIANMLYIYPNNIRLLYYTKKYNDKTYNIFPDFNDSNLCKVECSDGSTFNFNIISNKIEQKDNSNIFNNNEISDIFKKKIVNIDDEEYDINTLNFLLNIKKKSELNKINNIHSSIKEYVSYNNLDYSYSEINSFFKKIDEIVKKIKEHSSNNLKKESYIKLNNNKNLINYFNKLYNKNEVEYVLKDSYNLAKETLKDNEKYINRDKEKDINFNDWFEKLKDNAYTDDYVNKIYKHNSEFFNKYFFSKNDFFLHKNFFRSGINIFDLKNKIYSYDFLKKDFALNVCSLCIKLAAKLSKINLEEAEKIYSFVYNHKEIKKEDKFYKKLIKNIYVYNDFKKNNYIDYFDKVLSFDIIFNKFINIFIDRGKELLENNEFELSYNERIKIFKEIEFLQEHSKIEDLEKRYFFQPKKGENKINSNFIKFIDKFDKKFKQKYKKKNNLSFFKTEFYERFKNNNKNVSSFIFK